MALEFGPKLQLLVHADVGEEHYAQLTRLLRALDALIQCTVIDRTDTPPVGPSDGDCYVVGSSPTGDWEFFSRCIARWSDKVVAWEFYAPLDGWMAYNQGQSKYIRYDATAGGGDGDWVDLTLPP